MVCITTLCSREATLCLLLKILRIHKSNVVRSNLKRHYGLTYGVYKIGAKKFIA